jgi:hypothetical protein
MIVGMIVCLILLAIGALVIDVPRMERVGRMLQRAADAAALAGAAELNAPDCAAARQSSTPDLTELTKCWQRAKRSAFHALQQNPIYTTDGVVIPLSARELNPKIQPPNQQRDSFDIADTPGFDAEQYEFSHTDGVLRVQITRMIYTQALEKFSMEVPNTSAGVPLVEGGSVVDAGGFCDPVLSSGRCNREPAYRWANGMHIRLRVTGFPSILAQLPAVGIPASSEIERSGFAAPHQPDGSLTNWRAP